jgi:hypothetical protein
MRGDLEKGGLAARRGRQDCSDVTSLELGSKSYGGFDDLPAVLIEAGGPLTPTRGSEGPAG